MDIPTMDFGDRNLSGIVETLAKNNQVVWWNTFKKKNGRIMLKVEFADTFRSDQDLSSDFNPQQVSYKRLSENQSKRNYHRAKRHREKSDTSIEHPRNNGISHSTPVRDILDPSDYNVPSEHCLQEKSVSRESLIDYTAYTPQPSSREGVASCSHNAISPDSSAFSDATDKSFEKETINKSFHISSTDQNHEVPKQELHICQIENSICVLNSRIEVRHVKECGQNRFHCVLSRRDLHLKKWEALRLPERPDRDSAIEQMKSKILKQFKLEDCIDVPPDYNS